MIVATLAPADVGRKTWDAVVVGAGPAGAMAAIELGRQGLATLLVERQAFPREKVCGGCLNSRSLAILQEVGLFEDLLAAGAQPVTFCAPRPLASFSTAPPMRESPAPHLPADATSP